MQKRLFTFFIAVACLLTGCTGPFSAGINPTSSHPASRSFTPAAVPSNNQPADEILSPTDPNGTLNLGKALALTLMHNPELSAYSLEIRAAEARRLQAGLWANPELEIEIEEVGGTGERTGFDAAETTILLSQLIELGNKPQKREKVAAYEKELAELDYQSKKLEVFGETAKAFVAVLKAQQNLRLANDLLRLSEQAYETVEKRVRAGRDSPIEETRANVALTEMRIAAQKAQRNLDYARQKLASFWNQEAPSFERAAGDLDTLQPPPPLKRLTENLKQNPAYARWQSRIHKSRAVLELEKANAIGDVTVGAGMQRFNETDDNAFVFGISIPLPLSDRNQGARRQAAVNLEISRQQQRAAWLQLHNELNESYRDYANAYEQTVSLKTDVLPAAVELYTAARRAYQEGQADYLHVLDAQRTLFDAKKDYIESLSAYHTARMDIERLTGMRTQTVSMTESEE